MEKLKSALSLQRKKKFIEYFYQKMVNYGKFKGNSWENKQKFCENLGKIWEKFENKL